MTYQANLFLNDVDIVYSLEFKKCLGKYDQAFSKNP